MNQTARFFQIPLFFIVLLLSSCAVQDAQALKGPYQDALEAYYSGMETGQLKKAEEKASKALQQSPNDLGTRMLRAQIYLMQYRNDVGQPELKKQLLADLRIIQDNIDKVPETLDWVPPRVYTTAGDVLFLDGKQLLDKANADFSTDKGNAWRIMAYFNAATWYYTTAFRLTEAANDPTPGLSKEKGHALEGLLQSYYGHLEAIALLETAYMSADEVFSRTFEAERVQLIEATLNLTQGETAFITELPEVRLPLDPVFHVNAANLYDLVATKKATDIMALCQKSEPNTEQVLQQQAELRSTLHRMAAHRATGLMLGSGGDPNFPTTEMELGYNRDEIKPCD